MQRLYSLAISLLTLAALPALFALGDTTKPVTTTAKKKPSNVTAAKRAKAAPPSTSASRARAKTSTTAQSSAGRATTRRVVVTRKKVNGKWVRSTRIVKAPAPSYQLHPDTDRYQQIQQALAAKGFFKGEANGQWGDDSVDALKRFQASSNLPDDGKISSLSLINLGLGPRHEGSVTPVSTAPVSTAPVSTAPVSTAPVSTGPAAPAATPKPPNPGPQ